MPQSWFQDLIDDESPRPPWGRIAATFVGGVRAAGAGASQSIDQLMQWASYLTRNAPVEWGPTVAKNGTCAAKGCDGHAVTDCVVCGTVVCLAHGFISHHAELICSGCVLRAAQGDSGVDIDRHRALAVLGLDEKATPGDITDAQRRIARTFHPDKARSDTDRAEFARVTRDANAAAELLRRGRRRAA